MRILRDYVLKEMMGPLLASLAVFSFILLIGNMFKLADLLVNKGVDIKDVVKLFLYLIPYILSYTIPMAILTATMISFGRLASDNEVTAMRASGISLYKIGMPVVVVVFIISLASIYLNDRVLPASHFASYKLIKEVGIKNPTAYLEPGVFIKSFKGYIVRIGSIEDEELQDILIYQLQEKGPTRTIIAERGNFKTFPGKNLIQLHLINGTADEPNPNDPNMFYKLNFKTYDMTLDIETALGKGKLQKKPKQMTIRELKDDIAGLKATGADSQHIKNEIRERVTEIHKKLAMAFSSFAFVLVGLPLAINTRRREKSVGFGLSLVVSTIYYLIFIGGQALTLRNVIPPIIGVWVANLIYFIIGVVLIFIIIEK